LFRGIIKEIMQKISMEKILIVLIGLFILIGLGVLFYFLFFNASKSIKLTTLTGSDELQIGQTYEIKWKSTGINKVGIVLFKGQEATWIARGIPASAGKYDWRIYPGHQYGDDYWIAVFEYPWQKDSKISYSGTSFAITYNQLSACETLSIDKEWPYLPSDYPDLRRLFLTEENYSGNLGGIEGADKICQTEAEKNGYTGTWHAFLGGDSDSQTAMARIGSQSRGTNGIFIEAAPSAVLTRGATCHRVLGKNFSEFFSKFSETLAVNEQKFEKDFLDNLANIWLGRINSSSKKNCIADAAALENTYKALAEKYSFTSTCQNWTVENQFVDGYPVVTGQKPAFPTCYTPQGKSTQAVALTGLSSGISGKAGSETYISNEGQSCSSKQKLLCIEE
jgi:hypothetical protein